MIVLRNKEFSSKAQKLLRNKTDLIKGASAIESGLVKVVRKGQPQKLENVIKEDIISAGRKANRQNEITGTIHDSISKKAKLIKNSGASQIQSMSNVSKKNAKRMDLGYYDHGFGYNK